MRRRDRSRAAQRAGWGPPRPARGIVRGLHRGMCCLLRQTARAIQRAFRLPRAGAPRKGAGACCATTHRACRLSPVFSRLSAWRVSSRLVVRGFGALRLPIQSRTRCGGRGEREQPVKLAHKLSLSAALLSLLICGAGLFGIGRLHAFGRKPCGHRRRRSCAGPCGGEDAGRLQGPGAGVEEHAPERQGSEAAGEVLEPLCRQGTRGRRDRQAAAGNAAGRRGAVAGDPVRRRPPGDRPELSQRARVLQGRRIRPGGRRRRSARYRPRASPASR